MAAPATMARNPHGHRGRLGTLNTMECKGKSKFFQEHQAMRGKEENKGYDPSAHRWRFTEPAPLPQGKWKFPKSVLDEHAKEEKARLNREEKQGIEEKLQFRRQVEEELQKRKKQFPPGKAPPSDKQLRKEVVREYRLARAEERHVKNVQIAMRVLNKKYPDSNYELKKITEKCTIFEYGSAYCHYNFMVYSPSSGYLFCFAEVDADPENEHHVYQCCTIGSGPYGCCMGCLNQRVAVTHPSSDMFIGGQESFVEFCCDSDSDDDY
ncbi:unnamed protein product [Urochloa humidicola]